MKKLTIALSLVLSLSLLCGCSRISQAVEGAFDRSSASQASEASLNDASENSPSSVPSGSTSQNATASPVSSASFTLTDSTGSAIEASNNTYTITAAGEYTASGKLSDGQILINAGEDDKVTLILQGADISCSYGPAIAALSADKLDLEAKSGTANSVSDTRSTDPALESESEENYDGAIYAACDLEVSGKGQLTVTSSYDNGIKTKDDLEVKNLTLSVTAPGNALKGNDSITIESGTLLLISTASDGIKTSNSDISSKGNQKGTITISGGKVEIYAMGDGISAAYDVDILESAEFGAPEIIIQTASYSSYSDEEAMTQAAAEAASESGSAADAQGGLAQGQMQGQQGQLPGQQGQMPGQQGQMPGQQGQMPGGMTPGQMQGQQGQMPGGMMGGFGATNQSKTAFSSKGIKAENAIHISAGALTISAMDDGIHANSGVALENGETSTGSISISGGNLTITSADDGIHADGPLSVSGGDITIPASWEGLESPALDISGGTFTVYASDDGLNAGGTAGAVINISGGYLDITTPGGDTDTVDSNGNINISGGFLLIKSGAMSGMMAGTFDVDGSISVTGGTVISLGGMASIPAQSSVNLYLNSGAALPAGSYSLTDSSGKELASFTLDSAYYGLWIAAADLSIGESYSLQSDGQTALSWTQSSATEGSYGGFGGMMGPGGNGGFGGQGGQGGFSGGTR